MKAEDCWVDSFDGLFVEMIGVKGQREPKLPGVFAEVSREMAIDVGADFGMKSVSGVQNKVGVSSPSGARGLLYRRKEGDDAIATFEASGRRSYVRRDVHFKFSNAGIGGGALSITSPAGSSEAEHFGVR